MNDLEGIWAGWPVEELGVKPSGGPDLKAYNRKRDRLNDQKETLELLAELDPELVKGKSGGVYSDEQIRQILERIYQGCDGYISRRRHNFFVQGLERGVIEGLWTVKVPPPMVILHRESSPFTPETFVGLRALNQVYRLFLQSVEDAEFYGQAEQYLSRVILRKDAPEVEPFGRRSLILSFVFSSTHVLII